jgi:hypothetical protein
MAGSSSAPLAAAPEQRECGGAAQQQQQGLHEGECDPQQQPGAGLCWAEEDFELLDLQERTRTGAQASTSGDGGQPRPAAAGVEAPGAAPPPPSFNLRDRGFECSVTREAGAAPDWFVLRRVFERWQGRLNAIQLAAMVCRLGELSASTHARMLRSELGAFRRFVGALLLEGRGALPAADAGTVAATLAGLAQLRASGKVRGEAERARKRHAASRLRGPRSPLCGTDHRQGARPL